MALSWVIWAFTLPILKFCTIQGECEHVLGAGRHWRWVLIRGLYSLKISWPERPRKGVREVRN